MANTKKIKHISSGTTLPASTDLHDDMSILAERFLSRVPDPEVLMLDSSLDASNTSNTLCISNNYASNTFTSFTSGRFNYHSSCLSVPSSASSESINQQEVQTESRGYKQKAERYLNGRLHGAPTIDTAHAAAVDLTVYLKGESRGKSGGFKHPHFDFWTREKLEGMRIFLNLYTDLQSLTSGKWRASSIQAAVSLGRGTYCARQLRILARAYISDRKLLPNNPYGRWTTSMLADEDLVTDISTYLQELGDEITAEKLVTFLAHPDMMEKHSIDSRISIRTARRYLNSLNYRFSQPKKGQYKDGHDRADVVEYRDKKFIPQIYELLSRSVTFDRNGLPLPPPAMTGETNDNLLAAKGEGVTLMIADFVSAEFGFLVSPDGHERARREFKPGKNKDGYFTAEDVRVQADQAMDICLRWWPDYEHVFAYDNATTHLARAEGSLSARKMPRHPKENFGVDVTE
ncbi:hypothetical protein F5880DRAFT_1619331 [Lentinula raphanica]|nr:hypothetical protein F5880DRAFT_1619331 [Lentinula raphanica]